MLLGQRPESICNNSSCLNGVEGDRDVNKAHEYIQSASESGMWAGTCITTVEQSEKH